MMDNDIYMAAIEGRLEIPVEIHPQEDGSYKFTYDQHGIHVEVVDDSMSFGVQETSRLVLKKIRESVPTVLFS